jgi:calcineurin-like phosphoesterase family protein
MIFFTSDQHFGHVNIIKYTGRPFGWSEDGAYACSVHIRDEYNSVVSDDLVFHLGDYSLLKPAERDTYVPLVSSLKGHKVLITGNHDRESKSFY